MDKISTPQSNQKYCQNFVRQEDYNLYILHFFTPRTKRADILALMALHCELQLITKKATDHTMRLIRLQWWKDSIDKIINGDEASSSPILECLENIFKNNLISQDDLEHYFTSIENNLINNPTDTNEVFYKLMCDILNDNNEINDFSKILHRHNILDKNTKFRALRLWLGI